MADEIHPDDDRAEMRAEIAALRRQVTALTAPALSFRALGLKPGAERLLALLARRRGEVVPKEALLAAAAGRPDRLPGEKLLHVQVHHVRDAIARAGLSGVEIQTIWGVGYRLVDEEGRL